MLKFQQIFPFSFDERYFRRTSPLQPFARETLSFIEIFSNELLQPSSLRRYPELVALGFWMRSANMVRLRKQFQDIAAKSIFQPRGTVFHIAPSNVDSIFIYSWFFSMLCGNKNIVRLSSRTTSQLDLLIGLLVALLSQREWQVIAERILLVRYEHDVEVTTYFSNLCDVRIIWGGDVTISTIRQLPLPPLACEVAFANKFSLALVHAKKWNQAAVAQQQDWLGQFFNDVYWFGQAACSSPKLVVWQGDAASIGSAQDNFWAGLSSLVERRKTNLMPVDYVDKLVATNLIVLRVPGSTCRKHDKNDISRVTIDREKITQLLDADLHCGSGLFYEISIDNPVDLLPFLDRRIQTITYAGYGDGSELRDFVTQHILGGVDRIVPFGRALEFSHIWDGFDLFRVFLRQVTVV